MAADPLKLKYANVEQLVMAMLAVDPLHKKKVVARFKQLRNASFPPGVNVKAGRFLYDVDATMRVMLVFALMDALVLPAQAMALLHENWSDIRAAVDVVARGLPVTGPAPRFDMPKRPEGGAYMVISTGALGHWSSREEEEPSVERSGRLAQPGSLEIVTQAQLDAPAGSPAGARLAPAKLVLDLWTITAWTMLSIVANGWAKPAQLDIREG